MTEVVLQLSLSDLRRVVLEALAVYMVFWALGTGLVALAIWKSRRQG